MVADGGTGDDVVGVITCGNIVYNIILEMMSQKAPYRQASRHCLLWLLLMVVLY